MKRVASTILVETCPKCGKEIKGTSESQVHWNLKTHLDAKHKEEQK